MAEWGCNVSVGTGEVAGLSRIAVTRPRPRTHVECSGPRCPGADRPTPSVTRLAGTYRYRDIPRPRRSARTGGRCAWRRDADRDAASDTVAGAEAAGVPPGLGPILLRMFLQLGHSWVRSLLSNLDDRQVSRAQYCSW
jgi:hypothetical protein